MTRVSAVTGVLLAVVVMAGCGSATSSSPASSNPPAIPPSAAPTVPPVTTGPAWTVAGGATCPTLAQAEAALVASYTRPTHIPARGGGLVCEYFGVAGAANAGVTIYAHESATVVAGQIPNLGAAPGMKRISGVGSGAF